MSPSIAAKTTRPGPPTEAGPPRRLLHTIIALAGWVLFVWWWWIVLGRVSRQTAAMTLLFLGLSLTFIVLITVAWTVHNVLIFKRRGPRTHVREAAEDYRHDRLGRSVAFKPSLEGIRSQGVVMIRMEHEGKVYRPATGYPARSTAGNATHSDPERA